MSDQPVTSPRPADDRVRRLERRVTLLAIGLAVYVVASITIYLYDSFARQHRLSTNWLYAAKLTVPNPRFDAVSPMASLSTSCEDKVASLWLAQGPLRSLANPRAFSHQIRLALKESGEEELVFRDRAGNVRLRLALAPDGTPSIALLARRWLCPLVHLRWHALVSGLPCA